jgi:hypothetical protein
LPGLLLLRSLTSSFLLPFLWVCQKSCSSSSCYSQFCNQQMPWEKGTLGPRPSFSTSPTSPCPLAAILALRRWFYLPFIQLL